MDGESKDCQHGAKTNKLRVERMEPERWVKICWKEIKNNKETDWGGGMRKRLAKLRTD